jgi:hypothetical protein
MRRRTKASNGALRKTPLKALCVSGDPLHETIRHQQQYPYVRITFRHNFIPFRTWGSIWSPGSGVYRVQEDELRGIESDRYACFTTELHAHKNYIDSKPLANLPHPHRSQNCYGCAK